MNITPRDVNYFLAVAQHGRLARAAEACNVTQPALTKAIHRLETECGLTLFERDARGTRLTAEGARFREVAESLSKSYQDALRLAADVRAQQSGMLRVGSADSTRTSLVSAMLAALLRQRPGLRATLQIGQSDQLARAVEAGRLDVAVVPTYGTPPPGCDLMQVGDDPHLPVMSAKHPLSRRTHVVPADLAACGWISGATGSQGFKSVSALFARFALPPPIVIVEIEHVSEAVLSLVRTTELLTMVPRSAYLATDQQDLQLISIPEFHIDRPVFCLTRSGVEPSPLTRAFCDLVSLRNQSRQASDLVPGGIRPRP